jgi:hypothetical protein
MTVDLEMAGLAVAVVGVFAPLLWRRHILVSWQFEPSSDS